MNKKGVIVIRGRLLTRFFLEDGIRETEAYRSHQPSEVVAFAETVGRAWAALAAMPTPSEAETESEFIFPVLRLLGWEYLPQQEPGRGRRDIADALLFTSAEAKEQARKLRSLDRFRLGAVVVENEARETPLDRASKSKEAPSSQILRYLARAETQSDGAVRWGLLTNGRFWRLYWQGAPARAEGFVEFDLPGLVGDPPPPAPSGADALYWLCVFVLLFRREALVSAGAGPENFLDIALAEGRRYEQRATAALSAAVFNRVFPDLATAIAQEAPSARPSDAGWRAKAREAGLRLLYRLLFLLYAEDRDLLPVHHEGYRAYSLRSLREEAAAVADQHRTLSPRACTWWPRLTALFRAISEGDASLGLPPYNGKLFDDATVPLLAKLSLPDATLAPLLDAMSREADGEARRWINYRDLSVQQLGSIYERLLEQDVIPGDAGGLALRPNAFARKNTGSYYTPDELVRLILRRSVGPLLAKRWEKFRNTVEALGHDRRPKEERLRIIAPLDPAQAFVSLRVCDPAMGSGHFLVSLVDYLADEVLTAISEAPAIVPWADTERPYRSPLTRRIETLRAHILAEAAAHNWTVREDQLDDRHLVRRIILKRVIYGVDLNPMAVELAKLSLWLHSFTVGAPLSFLDHHLRCGDSLFGEFVGPVERDLHERYGLIMNQAVVRARQSAAGMTMIEELTDSDIGEVRSSASAFSGVEEATHELRAFLDLCHAKRWLPPENPAARVGREQFFGGGYGDPVAIAAGGTLRAPGPDAVDVRDRRNRRVATAAAAHAGAAAFLDGARALAKERRLLHWEVAFPGVWEEWEEDNPPGGFDAVIGNPPWNRMKMQEVEWFAARVPSIAHATRAADRKRMIETLRGRDDPIVAEYDLAQHTAEAAARVARESDGYPLLSGGDVNVYALFVERAMRLVRSDGIIGLLVPSGIAADKGASEFFRGISTTGRLTALIDFENRRTRLQLEPFFPDVDSRFKFLALIAGGSKRKFAAASCAFFQQNAIEAEANAFPLSPADFSTFNPNTGTAPVFRTRRDAEITRGIYERLPILVDRRSDPPRRLWPVHYSRMLDMTNDSGKFQTADELERLGAYRVSGQRWQKGKAEWLPLYEGKMVQAFDHRAASVVVNAQNLNRPAQPEPATTAQHTDPAWLPKPQFWVSAADIELPEGPPAFLAFKDITSPTNARTMIAALVPRAGFGNKLPLLMPEGDGAAYRRFAPLVAANLNALVLDYVARQKVQGTTLNLFIVEQLPLVPPGGFARRFGPKTAEQIIREDVLHLTYTSHDMAPFARDQGFSEPPFAWDENDRLRRRARLDALFFHLYGLHRDEADYILGTFPIVREEEEKRWNGRFRSRDLILGYMAALSTGSPDANIAG